MDTKVRAIVTGSTGMVGEGVLLECLNNPNVESILAVSRRSNGIRHPKLKEIIIKDFFDLTAVEDQLSGYNACFFCLGVSSVGMNENDYYKVTYSLTMNFAQTLSRLNPKMTFCYVSGAGTDSSEKGRLMWARVKGKTENDLMKLPFQQVFAFRPGFMLATKGQKNVLPYYKYVSWIYPVGKALFPRFFCTLSQVGRAMINCVLKGYEKKVLEVKDIITLADRK